MRSNPILAILLCLASGAAADRRRALIMKQTVAAAVGGAAFSDDFNRTDSDSLGANWTEAGNDAKIAGNQFVTVTGGFASVVAIYSGTACNTLSQYVKTTMSDGGGINICSYYFRFTDASTEHYEVRLDANNSLFRWFHWDQIGGTATEIASVAHSFSFPLTVGIMVYGTGNDTVVDVWVGPTGLPTGDGNWNGDNTPSYSLTTDPGNPVDTGSKVGIGGQTNVEVIHDDFFGGDVP
jgi:hypothetical protein